MSGLVLRSQLALDLLGGPQQGRPLPGLRLLFCEWSSYEMQNTQDRPENKQALGK